MKLQILVPRYNEPESVIKNLLDSINLQQGIDFSNIGVIICDDGSDILLTNKFLKSYKYDIKYFIGPHSGVSAARNFCLKQASADYIMFCDADDMFFDMMGIYIIFKNIDVFHFDTFISTFSEETYDENDNTIFLNRNNEGTFIHGKVYNRKYLRINNIWWKEELTVHEDSYFNLLAQSCTTNCISYDKPFYLWKNNRNSICRRDEDYELKTYNSMIDANDALIEQLIKRKIYDNIKYHIASLTLLTYKTLGEEKWRLESNKYYREKTEERFRDWWRKYNDIWYNGCEDKIKIDIWNTMKEKAAGINKVIDNIPYTIEDWLKHIESL